MDALKRKAKETLDDIKRAENKYKDLTRYLRLVKERAELAEEEAGVLKAKIAAKREELESFGGVLKEKQIQHAAKEEEMDESEKMRKTLEAKEFETDDQLVGLELKVRNEKKMADELEDKLAEAKVVHNSMKGELSELLARLNTAESKIVKLSEEADGNLVKLINLERRHVLYDQRQDWFEDRVEMKEREISHLKAETEANLAEVKGLEGQRNKLKTQVNSWKKRVAHLTRELEDCKADLKH